MTNAWIQRLLALAVIALCGTAAFLQWPKNPALALLCTAMPLLLMGLVEATQFVVLFVVNRKDSTPRASALQHMQAWWGELCCTAKVFGWWQPFRRAAVPDNLTPAALLPGVVLVHGFFCNRGFWTHWMRRLSSEGRVYVAVDLEPAFGSIDDYVMTIDIAVRQVREATGQPPVLVGHSMGGLAIRAWMATQSAQALQNNAVLRVITLGTPHHGTWFGGAAHSINGAQMRLDSPWLKALQEQENSGNAAKYVCFFSNCDNIVFPVSSAKLEAADNRQINAVGHVAIAHNASVINACWALLQK